MQTQDTSINKPVPCRCGREPEEKIQYGDFLFSLSCKCGTDRIQFYTGGNCSQSTRENWKSLITKTPYARASALVVSASPSFFRDAFSSFTRDPDERWARRIGLNWSRHGGPC